MASEGPNSPTLGVNVAAADSNWANPTNIYTSDDVRASAALPASASSDYLRSTGYGFAIPAGATIDGIAASIERSQTGLGECYDKANTVKLVKAGTETGTGLSSGFQYPTTDAYVNYGHSAYLWGTTWTPAEVNAGNFGLSTMAQEIGGTSSCTARIDHMQLTVYYTLGKSRSQSVMVGF